MLIASEEYIEPAFGLYSSGINIKALTLLSADTSNQGAPYQANDVCPPEKNC